MSQTDNADAAVTWSPIAILPNVEIHTEKLGGDHIALIGANDPRYRKCVETNDDLKAFLTSFTGSHGEPVKPSLIAISNEHGRKPFSHAVASFKDIVVAAVTLDVRVTSILAGSNRGPFYSNSFDIYPWMTSDRKDRLVATTPAISALHKLKAFVASRHLRCQSTESKMATSVENCSRDCIDFGTSNTSESRRCGKLVQFSVH